MGYIITASIIFFMAVVVFIVGIALSRSGNSNTKTTGRLVSLVAVVGGVVLNVALFLLLGFHTIEAGNIGIVYEFGAIVGQIGEGPNFVAPWRNVETADIRVQGHKFEKMNAFSIETQDVFIDATLNIRISPDAAQRLYRTVGVKFFDILVAPRVNQIFKDETVKYKSVDIAPNREQIRKAVRDRLEKELSPYSIEVADLLLDNVDFSQAFKRAIDAKQIATQNALREEQNVKVVQFQATQAVEKAKGDGAAIYAVAEQQAFANKKLSESLTPNLVQYSLIQKLGDKIQVMIVPSGQNLFLNVDGLKPAAASP